MNSRSSRAAAINDDIARWLTYIQASGRSARTASTYAAALKNLVVFLTQRRCSRSQNVRQTDLDFWQSRLVASGCQPSSVSVFVRAARGFFGWLATNGEVFENPAASLRPPKLRRSLASCPTEKDLKKLIASVRGAGPVRLRDRAILEIAYASGARLEEMVRLDIDYVDLETGVARLHGKGDRERMAPLTTAAVAATKRYLLKGRPQLSSVSEPTTALFLSARGGHRLPSSALARMIRYRARRCGLRISPHAIRRAFSSHLLRRGAPLPQLMALLGHQSYRHLKHYLRIHPREVVQGVRSLKPLRR